MLLKMENSERIKRYFLLFLVLIPSFFFGQKAFTHADSLRGGYGATRNWWDLKHYDLTVRFDIEKKLLSGCNRIRFSTKNVQTNYVLQLDLQDPMVLDSLVMKGQKLSFKKDGFAYMIQLSDRKSVV